MIDSSLLIYTGGNKVVQQFLAFFPTMNFQVVWNKETLLYGHTWAWRSAPKREGKFLKKLPKKYSFWSRKGEIFDNVRTFSEKLTNTGTWCFGLLGKGQNQKNVFGPSNGGSKNCLWDRGGRTRGKVKVGVSPPYLPTYAYVRLTYCVSKCTLRLCCKKTPIKRQTNWETSWHFPPSVPCTPYKSNFWVRTIATYVYWCIHGTMWETDDDDGDISPGKSRQLPAQKKFETPIRLTKEGRGRRF